ncbi:L-proline dehydrogenase [Ekhidna lutea]|uniref:L-proline dehydrogenase n=1 Tax=Ekhidna lutea TaxID=447679 RepID=A0A239JI23_EKHLU|nr:proline dehydrogenase family protein [Ekhidna lutea]SNT05459.1 L-proline dehydrogenase [Ekhidna lutea]
MQSEPINFDDTATAFAYRTNGELKNSHFVFTSMSKPWMVKMGTVMTNLALKLKLPVKGIIKKTIFNQFCGGESIKDCSKMINRLGDHNVETILDYSVEGLKNEDGYNDTKEEALRVIDFASTNDHIPFCVLKLSGLGSTDLMTKAQAKEKLTEVEKTKLYNAELRVDEIVKKASSKGLMVMIDGEESWFQSFIDGVAYRMMEKYNKDRPVVYNTYQLYRHDMLDRLKRAQIEAEVNGYYLGAKLVRGAYMEKERDRAEEMGYESPIHKNKERVDKDYDEALRYCMQHIDKMGICAGTHNENSSKLLAQLMAEHGISNKDNRVFFGQLLGMSDNISFKLADMGYNVAKYVPYGPVEKVLPYLFRRAEENTSIAGQSGREYTLVKKELRRRKSA